MRATTRICKTCRVEKPMDDFPLQGYGDFRRKECKVCWSVREQRRQRTWREKRRAWKWTAQERAISRLPTAQQANARRLLTVERARQAVSHAIRSGRLIRPTTCQDCGQSHPRIEGHHHDYTEPLSVIWLCHPCHVSWHRPARKQSV